MLTSFLEWIDHQLDERGPASTVRGTFCMIGITIGLAAIPGIPMVKIGVLLFLVAVGVILLLIACKDRARLLAESRQYQALLSRYCEFLADRPKPLYRIFSWRQVAEVERNGDIRETVDIQVATAREKIFFLQFKFRPAWEQPARQWKRTTHEVYRIDTDGKRVPDSGVTDSWEPDGALTITYHLHEPVRLGTKLHLRVLLNWPGKAIPLVTGKTDCFRVNFTKAFPVDYAAYVVILPIGMDAYSSPFGFDADEPDFSIKASENNTRREFTFEAFNVPLRRRVGMYLQLKEG